ncbi:MAG TPA: anti-sigma factor [Terriglobia bacterium]|nr:anti-sigma factor [Terriglobia bacterium]
MTHLEIENLASEYLEANLDEVRRAQVEEHLEACARCRGLVEDVRSAIEACQSVEEAPLPPWLTARIRRATLGEKEPGWFEQIRALPQLLRQPRFVYGMAMLVFSASLIVNASGFHLQNLTMEDLNPAAWYNQANRTSHLLYARAEKFYYDLRIVYEIESRFRDAQPESSPPEAQPGKQPAAPGPTANRLGLENEKLAFEISQPAIRESQGDQIHEMR